MNEELNKTIKEFYIKQQKLLNEMTNYSKSQLISIIEREMNENHYLRNEIERLNNIINELEKDLWEVRQLTFTKYNSNEWNNCLSFNDDIKPILDKLKQLKEQK